MDIKLTTINKFLNEKHPYLNNFASAKHWYQNETIS